MHSDVDIIYNTDQFAYSKRTSGFVPKTIFINEPTASADKKKEVIFFQDFGIPNPSQIFISIDEAALPEITDADIYDVFNYFGRWSFIRDLSDQERLKIRMDPVEFLLRNGFSDRNNAPGKKPENWWIPTWPAMLTIAEDPEPEWRSCDSGEAFIRREERKRLEEFDRKIRSVCNRCSILKNLAIRDTDFVHGRLYDHVTPCLARELHYKRGTIAPRLSKREAI